MLPRASAAEQFLGLFKAGFHMIADDRGSQVADDRKESCFHIIADNRKRSQSRLLNTFRSAEMSKLHAPFAGGKIEQTTWQTLREKFRCEQIYFIFLVLKRRHRQLQNRLQNLHLRRRFLPDFFQKLAFLFLSLKSLLLRW